MGVVTSRKVSTYLHILMDDAVSERVIDDGLHGSVAGVATMYRKYVDLYLKKGKAA